MLEVPQEERRERLAVSLADLDRVAPALRAGLLAGKLDLSQAIRVGQDRMEDVPAVVFTCDLLTAATICDILRSHDRQHGDPPTGLYINKDRAWTRVTNGTVLTVIVNGKVKLNPVVFPAALTDAAPPPAKKLFGSRDAKTSR